MVPPVLKVRVPRKRHVLVLNILTGCVVKTRRTNDLVGLLGRDLVLPSPSLVFLGPLLYLGEVAARVSGSDAWHDDAVCWEVDAERDRRDISMAHDGLSD